MIAPLNLFHCWTLSTQWSSSCRAPGRDGSWAAKWSNKRIHNLCHSFLCLLQFPCHAHSLDVREGWNVRRTAWGTWSSNVPLLPWCRIVFLPIESSSYSSCFAPFIYCIEWSCCCSMLVTFLYNNVHSLVCILLYLRTYNHIHCKLTIFIVSHIPVSSRASITI